MKPGFKDSFLDVRSTDGRNDTLLTELHFRDINNNFYRVPKGTETDGGSTPRLAWICPGFEPTGDHWFAWILHDSAYRGTLEIRHGLDYVPANLTRLQSDELLDRALTTMGMSPAKRKTVFLSLRGFGWRYFRKP